MNNDPQSKKETILLVDDTPANLRVLSQLLTAQGYRARAVPSGAYALSSLQSALPDLILLDIMMPEMNGYALCRVLKAKPETRDIPVIFISALDETFDKVKAFSLGAVDYISKPFQEQEVLARVETHLNLRRLQRALQEQNEALQNANYTLEDKVAARTAALEQSNRKLQAEIEQGRRYQQEKDRLFELLQQQSEQLRLMTQNLLESQKNQRQALSTGLEHEIQPKIAVLRQHLENLQNRHTSFGSPDLNRYFDETNHTLTEIEDHLRQVSHNLNQSGVADHQMQDDPLLQLSTRERQVLHLLADGKNTSDIANILIVTTGTVQTYIRRIRHKLDIADLTHLIQFARNRFND